MILSNQKSVIKSILILLILLVVGCDTSKKGSSRGKQVETYSTSEKYFFESQTRMETIKASIEKHKRNIEMSTKNYEDILDDRELQDAKFDIVALSGQIIDIANNGLSNEDVVAQVSFRNTYNDYLKYANDNIDQYGSD